MSIDPRRGGGELAELLTIWQEELDAAFRVAPAKQPRRALRRPMRLPTLRLQRPVTCDAKNKEEILV